MEGEDFRISFVYFSFILVCILYMREFRYIDSRGVARPRFPRGLWLLLFNWRNPTIHEWFKFNSFVISKLQYLDLWGSKISDQGSCWISSRWKANCWQDQV
ncbi:uncharacterized protein LOC110769301 isoform X1 [Prunus avium]|uniref:Uncharacterized protein LOC110769301 isoform X1 n=2 Tax=Prunus avium TaxID=42229 RepID=A0A6P5TMU1_PRUAV|nr:uncharacterized protein LOC110769301 isoform X1 [Prunus avium]